MKSYAKMCCLSCKGTSCHDEKSNCPELAKTNCKEYGRNCKKSCGLCDGMTPHDSNTCPDLWLSCKTYWKDHCNRRDVKKMVLHYLQGKGCIVIDCGFSVDGVLILYCMKLADPTHQLLCRVYSFI